MANQGKFIIPNISPVVAEDSLDYLVNKKELNYFEKQNFENSLKKSALIKMKKIENKIERDVNIEPSFKIKMLS